MLNSRAHAEPKLCRYLLTHLRGRLRHLAQENLVADIELQERYEVLREISQLISSGVDIAKISKTIVRQAAFRFSSDVAVLFTLSDNTVLLRAVYGIRQEEIPGQLELGNSVLDRVFQLGGILSVPGQELRKDSALSFLADSGIATLHLSTLEAKDETLGVILLGMRDERILNKNESRLLEEFSQAIAAAVAASLSQEKIASYAEKLEELVHRRTADLVAQKSIAEEANRAKGRFVANMSHELRTPLTAIVGYSSVLAQGVFGSINDKQKDALLSIQRSSEHLKELIDEVLNLSKIEAGKEEPEPSKVELFSLLQQIQKLMLQTAVGKGVELKPIVVSETDKLVKLFIDPRHIRQILLNLVSNAVKYTPSGGSACLSATIQGDMVRIAVTDTGVGVTPDEANRLFSRFERGDDSYSREQVGTGLGLSLTKILVERNGGRIGVISEKNQGSEFWVIIPIAEGTVTTVDVSAESESFIVGPRLEGLNILVVDDNPSTCQVISDILVSSGADVRVANRVPEAREILETGQFDICLVDLAIPGESGLVLMEQIRRGDIIEKNTIPLLVVSGCVFDKDRDQAMLSGANGFLAKPFNPNELIESIRELTISSAVGSASRIFITQVSGEEK